jgi:predicted nuclease of predicted toxin-antitoxin system
MRIKLDENLPAGLVEALAKLGHDVDSVPQEALSGQPDSKVWDAAQNAQRFLVTQDLDFSDVRRFAPGTHQGILLVRLSNPSRRHLIERIQGIFGIEAVETWRQCFVVVTDLKIRIQRSG